MIKTKASNLLFNMSESEEEQNEIEVMPKVSVSARLTKTTDLFGSTGMGRGLFSGKKEDEEYQIASPIVTDYKPQPKQHEGISIVKEVQHESKDKVRKIGKLTFSCPLGRDRKKQADELRLTTPRKEVLDLDFDSSQEGSNKQEEQKGKEGASNDSDNSEQQEEQEQLDINKLKFNQLKQITINSVVGKFDITVQRLRDFSFKELQLGRIAHFSIMRDRSGFNTFWPEFKMFFKNNAFEFLHAKKMKGSTGANYYITSMPGVQDIENEHYIGKLRGNYAEDLYNVFDAGVPPSKVGVQKKVRTIQATVHFLSQEKEDQPRRFELFVLKQGCPYFDLTGTTFGEEKNLMELYKQEDNRQKIHHFMNREAKYTQSIKGYTMNFGGRVEQPSIKNAILEDPQTKREVLMLGKTQDDYFRLDVSGWLSPLHAFCLCVANFDSKFVSS